MKETVKIVLFVIGGIIIGLSIGVSAVLVIVNKCEEIRKGIYDAIFAKIEGVIFGNREAIPNGIDDWRTFIFDKRGDAEKVMNTMTDCVDRYGEISIYDYCELLGIISNYQNTKYGWTDKNFRKITKIKKVSVGYIIVLPEPEEIKTISYSRSAYMKQERKNYV